AHRDAIASVAGNDVARACQGAADGVAGARIENPHAGETIAECRSGTAGAHADIVPLDRVGRRAVVDLYAGSHIARDDVSCGRCGAADEVAARVIEEYTPEVADARGAGGVGADVISGDLVARGAGILNLNAGVKIAAKDVAHAGGRPADDVIRGP